jgi:hypothetical protein
MTRKRAVGTEFHVHSWPVEEYEFELEDAPHRLCEWAEFYFLGYMAIIYLRQMCPYLLRYKNERQQWVTLMGKIPIPSVLVTEHRVRGDLVRPLWYGSQHNYLVLQTKDPRLQQHILAEKERQAAYWTRPVVADWRPVQESVQKFAAGTSLATDFPGIPLILTYIERIGHDLSVPADDWLHLYAILVQWIMKTYVER